MWASPGMWPPRGRLSTSPTPTVTQGKGRSTWEGALSLVQSWNLESQSDKMQLLLLDVWTQEDDLAKN